MDEKKVGIFMENRLMMTISMRETLKSSELSLMSQDIYSVKMENKTDDFKVFS